MWNIVFSRTGRRSYIEQVTNFKWKFPEYFSEAVFMASFQEPPFPNVQHTAQACVSGIISDNNDTESSFKRAPLIYVSAFSTAQRCLSSLYIRRKGQNAGLV